MDTDSHGGSTFVRRWQLAELLKNFREAAGLTQAQAVAELKRREGGRWSGPKLSRVENRTQAIRTHEVAQLLDLYGVPETERPAVLEMAEQARARDWRPAYGVDAPEPLRGLISLEDSAVTIRSFEPMLVPGLLQTPDYARAVMQATPPAYPSTVQLERAVARRVTRQHILRKDPAPALHFVLDEGVLLRRVGGRTVMRDQLRRLADLREVEHVTIQLVPLSSGGGPGVIGPFTLLSLPHPAPDVLYGETAIAGSLFLTDEDRVRDCTLRFGMLRQLAMTPAESADRIEVEASRYEQR